VSLSGHKCGLAAMASVRLLDALWEQKLGRQLEHMSDLVARVLAPVLAEL